MKTDVYIVFSNKKIIPGVDYLPITARPKRNNLPTLTFELTLFFILYLFKQVGFILALFVQSLDVKKTKQPQCIMLQDLQNASTLKTPPCQKP